MCSMYWNYIAEVEPPCGHTAEIGLQTHFMGEVGSCGNWYRGDERVAELGSYTGRLEFVGDCDVCAEFFTLDAVIENGRVVQVLEANAVQF